MDILRLLTTGAKFRGDRKFKHDHDVVDGKSSSSHAEISALSSDIKKELDFFHDRPSPVNISAKAKKDKASKKRKIEDDSGEGTHEAYLHDTHEQDHKVLRISAQDLRKINRIKVTGSDPPDPISSFSDLLSRYAVKPFLKQNLQKHNFSTPTPVQMQAIPILLEGRDLMTCAPTGTGKTLAFLVPLLQELMGHKKVGYRAVILSPTRELAKQVMNTASVNLTLKIHNEIKWLSEGRNFKICMLTKATASTQAHDPTARANYDIIVSTPLRLVHELKQGHIKLDSVRHFIFDEADKLFELSFLEQIDEILAACTCQKLQKAMFSATLPSEVERMAKTLMKDPIRVIIGTKDAATNTVEQSIVYTGTEEGKLTAIRQLISSGGIQPPVLIFVQSIDRAKALFTELVYDGINVDVIHGERTKAQRDAVIERFQSGEIWVLICSEILARGIDFKGVAKVINYDCPQTVQSYVHRIGRTGRAGRSGEAVTFVTKADSEHLRSIANVMKQSGCKVSNWMLKLPKPSKNTKKKLKKRPVTREIISTVPKVLQEARAHKKYI
ncbi:ATP-dependent RNA helicase ROK1 [Neolecta irregularis DAH-3]|uniref:RNA helicase n=1 Tax=Neolecta irregularis (strain DAH-3) TaxID=1198029 RepID=A0A1U7LUW2_NEOID|nr:ATP-dependent RNA helicase ROK1 [Neolecta irregularis DAH-3]|eukprot:OLL26460.1 ATP-dependent RNA helicase ROK1 [Neolecta irregularis DAH-3]